MIRLLKPQSRTDLSALELDLVDWVEEYEALYYQFQPRFMRVCRTSIHFMLHLISSIKHLGLLYTTWQFPAEQYAGIIKRKVKSQVQANRNLSIQVMLMERLNFLPLCSDWIPKKETGGREARHPDDSRLTLYFPREECTSTPTRLIEYLSVRTTVDAAEIESQLYVVKWARASNSHTTDNEEPEMIGSAQFQSRITTENVRANWHVKYCRKHARQQKCSFATVFFFSEVWLRDNCYFLAYIQELETRELDGSTYIVRRGIK